MPKILRKFDKYFLKAESLLRFYSNDFYVNFFEWDDFFGWFDSLHKAPFCKRGLFSLKHKPCSTEKNFLMKFL